MTCLSDVHFFTISTTNCFAKLKAAALYDLGNKDEAMTMMKEVMVLQKRVLGESHRNTLNMATNIATGLREQGKFVQAEGMYREVLALNTRAYGALLSQAANSQPPLTTNLMVLSPTARAYGDLLSLAAKLP
jgi:hypothetical protein